MKQFYLIYLFIPFIFFSCKEKNTENFSKPRLIVLSDIGQDPDDQQSMVRLLHFADRFKIEGLIATADNNYEHEAAEIKDSIIYALLDKYEQIQSNLSLHSDFPKAETLRAVVKKGSNKGGVNVPVNEFIGEGFDTEGSEWIINVVDEKNIQPANISVWGGACDLAQALWKVKKERSPDEVKLFVSKLRVYFIGLQDISNQWIIGNFPDLWLVLALDRGGNKWQSSYRGVFWGGDMSNTTKEWIHTNLHEVNPLGKCYPDKAWTGGTDKNPHMAMKEGDTPSMLFFMENGLNVPSHPEWGGWGGRFSEDRPGFFRDAVDTVFDEGLQEKLASPRATVFRWRKDFQNEFAARAQWANHPFNKANHAPQAVVNGHTGFRPLFIESLAGQNISLDATESNDPDGDALTCEWFQYLEAGTSEKKININNANDLRTKITVPEQAEGTIHIILKVTDNGTPQLCGYKRVIVGIKKLAVIRDTHKLKFQN